MLLYKQTLLITVCPVCFPKLHGFFKGMAFPALTSGLSNSAIFGSYCSALDYLTRSRPGDRVQGKEAPAAHVFAAGCFSGLVGVMETPQMSLFFTITNHSDQHFQHGNVMCLNSVAVGCSSPSRKFLGWTPPTHLSKMPPPLSWP